MLITAMERYKGETICCSLSDGQKLYLSQDIIDAYHLRRGMDITGQMLQDVTEAADFRRARRRAYHLLAVRDYSYVELSERLCRNYGEDISYRVCDLLAKEGYLNDWRYGERLAEWLWEEKKFGLYRIRQEMRRRGLSDEVIERSLAPYGEADGEDTARRLAELIQSRYGGQNLWDEKSRRRVVSALMRRGYAYSQIRKAIGLCGGDTDNMMEDEPPQ